MGESPLSREQRVRFNVVNSVSFCSFSPVLISSLLLRVPLILPKNGQKGVRKVDNVQNGENVRKVEKKSRNPCKTGR